mgnify:FL=1
MKLLDANIFMYASGADHRLKQPSTAILSMVREQRLDANTDIEAFQEIMHVYQSRRDVKTGIAITSAAMLLFPNALPVTIATIRGGADILARYPAIQSRDAIHAAVVFENGLEGIISADRGLDVIAGLVRFDPKELAA